MTKYILDTELSRFGHLSMEVVQFLLDNAVSIRQRTGHPHKLGGHTGPLLDEVIRRSTIEVVQHGYLYMKVR